MPIAEYVHGGKSHRILIYDEELVRSIEALKALEGSGDQSLGRSALLEEAFSLAGRSGNIFAFGLVAWMYEKFAADSGLDDDAAQQVIRLHRTRHNFRE